MKYPYPCSRCGMCCLAETCPAGQHFFGSKNSEVCKGLSFDGDVAKCSLVGYNLVPVGDGCCIKATAYINKLPVDYSSLSPEYKKAIVKKIRRRGKNGFLFNRRQSN